MRGFALRLAINVFGLWVASSILSGMSIEGFGSFVLAGLLLGVVNAVIRPIAILFTLPLTVFSLGLFLLVINAAMLGLVAWLVPGFEIASFGSALAGSIVVSLTSWLSSWYIGPRGGVEVLVIRGETHPG